MLSLPSADQWDAWRFSFVLFFSGAQKWPESLGWSGGSTGIGQKQRKKIMERKMKEKGKKNE